MKNYVKKLLSIVCVLALIFQNVVCAASDGTKIYVSPNGDDNNPGTVEKPIKTVEKAYQKILSSPKGKVSVFFDDGEFFVEETIEFDANKLNGKELEITTYGEGQTIFNSGKVITGWQETEEGYWKAPVDKNTFFRTLYFNDKKGTRARYPNADEYIHISSVTEKGFITETNVLLDVKNYADRLEVGLAHAWMTKFLRVNELIQSEANVEIIINEKEWNTLKSIPQGAKIAAGEKSKMWLENSLEFLDSPGEWYLDEINDIVYFYPYPHNTIDNTVIYSGNLENIMRFTGNTENHIKSVKISGIKFTGTDWTYPSFSGFIDIQANSIAPADLEKSKDTQYRHNLKKQKLPGAIHTFYTDDILIENCVFEGIAANGIVFEEGGKNISVTSNVFTDVGSTAIEVGGDYYRAKNTDMFHQNVLIDNNLVNDIANYYYGGVGILAYYVDGLTITHNHVKNCSYSGISTNWGWQVSEQVKMAKNYTISFNHVENFMSRLVDGGGIYTPCPLDGENTIEGNYIIGNATNFDPKSGSNAIYHDGASSNWLDKNNVLEDITPFALQAVAGQETAKITMQNNHHNQLIYWDSKLADIVSENNIYYPTNDFNEEAQTIIENAGIENKELDMIVPQAYIKRDFYEKIVPGQDMEFELTIKNYQAEANLTIELELPDGVTYEGEKTIHLEDNEERKIPVILNTDVKIPEGFYIVPINVYGGNKMYIRTSCAFSVKDKYNVIVDIGDEGYQEVVGDWSASGLQGYSSSSKYGYNEGAKAIWSPKLPTPGEYEVKLWIMPHSTSDDKAQIEIKHSNGIYKEELDFTTKENGWYSLGVFEFDQNGYVSNTLGNKDRFVRASAAAFTKDTNDAEREVIAQENQINKLCAELVYLNDKDYCFVNGYKQKLSREFNGEDMSQIVLTPSVLAKLISGIIVDKGNEVYVIKGCVGYRFKKGNSYYEINGEKIQLDYPIDDQFTIPALNILKDFGYNIKSFDNGLTTVSKYDITYDEKTLNVGKNAFVE